MHSAEGALGVGVATTPYSLDKGESALTHGHCWPHPVAWFVGALRAKLRLWRKCCSPAVSASATARSGASCNLCCSSSAWVHPFDVSLVRQRTVTVCVARLSSWPGARTDQALGVHAGAPYQVGTLCCHSANSALRLDELFSFVIQLAVHFFPHGRLQRCLLCWRCGRRCKVSAYRGPPACDALQL